MSEQIYQAPNYNPQYQRNANEQQGQGSSGYNNAPVAQSANMPNVSINALMSGNVGMSGGQSTGYGATNVGLTNTVLQNPNVFNGNQYAQQGSSNYANQTYAGIVRDEMNDYITRFVPIEDQYRELTLNPAQLLDQQLAKISTRYQSANTRFQNQADKINQRYGITQTQRQQANQQTQSALQQGLNIAHAKNASRLQAKDRQLSMLANAGGMRPDTQQGAM